MADQREEGARVILKMLDDILPALKAKKAIQLMKEHDKSIDDILEERDMVLRGMQMFWRDIKTTESLKELVGMMEMIMRQVVERDDKNARLVYGFMMTCFFQALAAGNPFDIDIMHGRLEINIQGMERTIKRQYEETIAEIKKQTSGDAGSTEKKEEDTTA